MGEVEENYVVPEQEFGTVGIVVKFVESTREGSTIMDERLGLAWPNGCKALDAVSTWINLEVDRNASGQKLRQRYRFRSQPVFQIAPSSVASPRLSLPDFSYHANPSQFHREAQQPGHRCEQPLEEQT